MTESPNPNPEHKSVALLIWATTGLVALNLVMVLLVFLPPKRTTLRGVVVFRGRPPEVLTYDLARLDPACAKALGSPYRAWDRVLSTQPLRPEFAMTLVTGPSNTPRAALVGAVVRIKSPGQTPAETPLPTNGWVLDSLPCQISPSLLVVSTNQPVEFRNSAAATQVLLLSGTDSQPPRTIQQAAGQTSEPLTFSEPGQVFTVTVRERPWIRADILVLAPQPFGVSDQDGVFEFRGRVPREGAELEVIHPIAGRKTFRLTQQALRAPIVLEFGTD